MKQVILCLFMAFMVTCVFGQTPPYYKGLGTAGNTIPMSNPGSHCQQIYEPGDFNFVPISGLITKIYFRNSSAGASATYTNFSVGFLQNSLTAFPNSTFLTGFTNALTSASITINGNPTSGGWYEIPLAVPFLYDNSQNLIVEIKYDSRTGGTMSGYTTTASGNKRLSIITAPGAVTGNLSSLWGDFGMEVIPATPCSGAIGGSASASVSSSCPNTNFTILTTGVTVGLNTEYQWQSSTNGLIWDDVLGQTSSNFSGSQTAATNYRLRVICNVGPDTAYSNSVFVDINSYLDCYCTSGPTLATNSSIRNVTFSTLNNTSATACSQYTDYSSADTAVVNLGLTYPVSILVEDCEGTSFGTQGTAVFIDWNHDGDFDDADEWVFDPATQAGAATVLFTGDISVPVTALTGLTRMRVINRQSTAAISPCGSYSSYGETEDYIINVLPPPANEAGVLAITRPGIATCNLGQAIWVNLQNLGSDTLTSATFSLVVNGINIPVTNTWTGVVPPQSIEEVQVPVNYALADGDSVLVTVSFPNGQIESPVYAFNNSIGRRIYEGLSGNKSVYGVGADFSNMDEAIQALILRGVCDTVYFKIATGNYTTQHVFPEYPLAGPGKLAVFESATGLASDVVYNYPATSATDNYVFKIDGGDNYMFRNLTAINSGASFSRVVDILNGANDISFIGNTLMGDTAASYLTSDFTKIVVASVNATDDNRTLLRNNHILGGNRGINLGGGSSYETGHVVEGNVVEKYSYIGIILGSLAGFDVSGNTFIPKENLTQDAYGIYANGTVLGGAVAKNTVNSNRSGSSIYLTNAKGVQSSLLVSNNFLYMSDSSATGITRGITLADVNSAGIILANNSISLQNNNPNSGAITLLDGTEYKVINNNVGSFGLAPALRVEKAYSLNYSNNNNLFASEVSNVVGVVYASLNNHQSGTGFDVASISVAPGYNGSDLHTCAAQLNGAAEALSYITEDYDGDVRFTTPDIGADEFLGDANGLLAEDEVLKCPNEQVVLGNQAQSGVSYSWTPSGSSSQISTTAAGNYVVTATSSCGVFSDTVVVTNKPLPTASFSSTSVGLTGIFTNTSTNGVSYLWNFNDGATSTDENPVHVYGTAGTYQVTLTVTNECGTSTFGPVPVNAINASVEENEMDMVKLYPNPTDGIFSIVWSAETTSNNALVTVYDITGKVLVNKNLENTQNQVTMDMSAYKPGVYTVKLVNGDNVKTFRLVKK